MCLRYEHAHFSDDDDERAVQVCLKMKEMPVFLSGFITLNSGVFYTLLSSVISAFHLSVLTHLYSTPPPHWAVTFQAPWLDGVIFTQRRPLIGSQWCSKDFDGEIETNRLNFTEVVVRHRPALTDFLVGNLILNIQGLNRQMNASLNTFSHLHPLINWRSNLFECRKQK